MQILKLKSAMGLMLGAALLTGSVALRAAPTNDAGFVYTGNEGSNDISAIDLRTGRVKTTAVSISPHNVQISRDGRLLLAVGMVASKTAKHGAIEGMEHGGGKKMRGRLLILDARTMSTQSASAVEVGVAPAHVVVDRQGKRAYITNAGDNNLSVVDVAQRKVVATIKTGTSPHGLRFSPNGRELYVANTGGNSVSVISVAAAKEVSRIWVGKAPVQVGFTPDGRRVYVSLRDQNSVAVIDAARRKKVATIAVGRNPIQVFATPNGRYIYVANQGSETKPGNTASVINTATNRVTATVVTGKGSHGVVVSDDGKRAFIVNTFADTVSVIDTATHKVLRSIKVGEEPGGITFRGATR